MLKTLSIVRQQHTDFVPEWRRTSDDIILQHPRLAAIHHAVVCDVLGQPIYDQPIWVERAGAVCVAVNEAGAVALLRQHRHVMLNDDGTTFPDAGYANCGKESLEFPRGFAEPGEDAPEAARREVEEELLLRAMTVEFLGQINSNTTFVAISAHVYLVTVACQEPSLRSRDAAEAIESIQFVDVHEMIRLINDGQISCGITLAAFSLYLARAVAREQMSLQRPLK